MAPKQAPSPEYQGTQWNASRRPRSFLAGTWRITWSYYWADSDGNTSAWVYWSGFAIVPLFDHSAQWDAISELLNWYLFLKDYGDNLFVTFFEVWVRRPVFEYDWYTMKRGKWRCLMLVMTLLDDKTWKYFTTNSHDHCDPPRIRG